LNLTQKSPLYFYPKQEFYVEKVYLNQNQTFHYTRHITPKRVTSLRCPSPRHSVKATQLLA